ncbi:MAG: hypothetical protein U0794_10300 [Isosphaeraceae bacterium]
MPLLLQRVPSAKLRLVIPALMLAGIAGCGTQAATAVPTVAVSGRVTYKGQPLTCGSLVFEPDDAGRSAHGEIGADGRFVLSTFKQGDGAMPGVFRIGIADAAIGKTRLPSKYRNPSSSHVQVDVSAEKTDYLIALE